MLGSRVAEVLVVGALALLHDASHKADCKHLQVSQQLLEPKC